MELADLIQKWASFFSEESTFHPLGRKGDSGETGELGGGRESKKRIFSLISSFSLSPTTSDDLFLKYLGTLPSTPSKIAATLAIEPKTDEELGALLKLDNPSRDRNKIGGKVEAFGSEKPKRWTLRANEKVDERRKLRSWLDNLKQAAEKEERELEAARQREAAEARVAVGTLRADLAEQFRKGDYAVLVQFVELAEFDPDLAGFVLDHPVEALKAAELSFKSFDVEVKGELRILVEALPPSCGFSVSEVRTRHLGQLVELVVEPESVSDVAPISVSARFECPSCGNIIPVLQLDEKFKEPSRCGCGRKGKFRLLDKNLKDFAIIGVTQPIGEVLNGQGRRARLSVHVIGLLATPERMKKITPGAPLRLVGVPSEAPVFLRNGSKSRRSDIVIEAVSFAPVVDYSFSLDFTSQELEEFRAAAKEEGFLDAFATSCYPGHYGDDHVKRALVLQLLSGRFDQRVDHEGLNVLLSGDPGVGKTRNFLRRSELLAPIVQFAQATNSTKAGLLGSGSTKDSDTGRFVYEPGSLSRAHRGLLIIDELASLAPEETKALNEALDEGTITTDKATLHLKVPADVACLAAANPKGDRFDEYGVTPDKLNILPSTLNRFDLVYVLMDYADKERDSMIVDAMTAKQETRQRWRDEWLSRYVLFARFAVKPRLREADSELLKRFFVGMRQSGTAGGLAISPRQFESLRALTLLSAKAHLREETIEDDVRTACALVEPMLKAFGYDLSRLNRWL